MPSQHRSNVQRFSINTIPVKSDSESESISQEEYKGVKPTIMAQQYPNWWSRCRHVFSALLGLNNLIGCVYVREYIREPFAEFLGVAILIIFGTGVNCQVVLGGNPNVVPSEKGSFLSINMGWAVGVALGVWVSAGISGGHINPAVTLALATFRGFPWRKVPKYIISQVLGGLVGAAVVYGNYFHAINIVEGRGVRTLATAGLFATYPAGYMTNISAFCDEFLGTCILMIIILATTDKHNYPPPQGLLPLALFILTLGIGTSLGMETGYAINPARDLGPRLMTALVGYGIEVFSFKAQYWLWCPVIAPILGAQFGTLVYDTMLYVGDDSVMNKPSDNSVQTVYKV